MRLAGLFLITADDERKEESTQSFYRTNEKSP